MLLKVRGDYTWARKMLTVPSTVSQRERVRTTLQNGLPFSWGFSLEVACAEDLLLDCGSEQYWYKDSTAVSIISGRLSAHTGNEGLL